LFYNTEYFSSTHSQHILSCDFSLGGFIPRLPYVKALPEGLKDQTFITIHGQPELNADRFRISFYKGDDIAFYFNPRFNEEVIVRNSRTGDVWQKEERELSFFPFTPGEPFEIKIICTSSGFSVEVDHTHLLNFSHRIKDIENLTTLVIDGNITLKHVAIGGFIPRVPYVKVLPEGLKDQTVITIHGQPESNADRFRISFYKGDDIAFHFNPRFNKDGKEVIVRNSMIADVWQKEERELSFFPFTPGKPFEIKIICTWSEFIVEVDNNHLLNFSHRMKDIGSLTTFVIGGNIVLKDVTGM
ncbi:hypothetical protein NFI96_032944, partial [Prochilodus magdalenae]